MEFVKKNKGALILYVVIMIFSLVLMNDVKREEHDINNSYVMVDKN